MKKPKVQAIMNVEKDEAIAGMWVSPPIPQIGFYKLLAKKKTNGTCAWVHFLQRENGSKKELFRGEVESEDRLNDIVNAVNATLGKTFGIGVKLKVAEFDTYMANGKTFGDTVH
jgi:hypothetical protein